jgi:hypothetical protein
MALKDMFLSRQADAIASYLSAIDLIANERLCGCYCDMLGVDYAVFRERVIARLHTSPRYTREELRDAVSYYKPAVKELGAA